MLLNTLRGAAALLVAGLAAAPAFATDILAVDFDSMTLDAPCPTGGAAVNEPWAVTFAVIGTIRDAPFPTPCVEIQDNHESTSGWVSFQFTGDQEITDGIVTMELDLWIPSTIENTVTVAVREPRFASQSFANVRFGSTGSIHYSDASGSVGTVGGYTHDQAVNVRLVFDMDVKMVDVFVDDALFVEDREFGIIDRGVGSILVSYGHDAGTEGHFYVDNVSAEAVGSTPIETVSWSGVKAGF